MSGPSGSGLTNAERVITRASRRNAAPNVQIPTSVAAPISAPNPAPVSAPSGPVSMEGVTAATEQPQRLMADAIRAASRPDVSVPLTAAALATLTEADLVAIRALAANVQVNAELARRNAEQANELAGNDANAHYASIRHLAPKPPIFTNSTKGPNVRSWLRHVKEYQTLLPPPPAERVRIAALYLGEEVAEHWYLTRDPLQRNGIEPTWTMFEGHLLKVYGAIDVDMRARKKLDALTLSCNFNMTEYVQRYTNLLALIPARNEHDQCHFFLKGLPTKLHTQMAVDPSTLMRWDNFDRLCTYACRMHPLTAKTFGVDLAPTTGESNVKSGFTTPKKTKKHNNNGNGRTSNVLGGAVKKPAFDANRWKGTLIDSFDKLSAFKKEGRCIFCGDKGHLGKECKKNKGKGPM